MANLNKTLEIFLKDKIWGSLKLHETKWLLKATQNSGQPYRATLLPK